MPYVLCLAEEQDPVPAQGSPAHSGSKMNIKKRNFVKVLEGDGVCAAQ